MSSTGTDTVEALAEEHAQLGAMVGALSADGWAAPSRCPGWSVADVVLHLAQTDELALASLHGDLVPALEGAGWSAGPGGAVPADVDAAAGAAVLRQRGAPATEVFTRWSGGSAALIARFREVDHRERVPWVAGQLSARTLATTRIAETWIHAGDVAEALGKPHPPSARLEHIARLAWRTLPYAFARAGRSAPAPIALALIAPDGSPWNFTEDSAAPTVISGSASEFCLVAARRLTPAQTSLRASGPDGAAALELVRTFA